MHSINKSTNRARQPRLSKPQNSRGIKIGLAKKNTLICSSILNRPESQIKQLVDIFCTPQITKNEFQSFVCYLFVFSFMLHRKQLLLLMIKCLGRRIETIGIGVNGVVYRQTKIWWTFTCHNGIHVNNYNIIYI